MKPLLADSQPSLLKFTAQQISLLALHTFPSQSGTTTGWVKQMIILRRGRNWENARAQGAAGIPEMKLVRCNQRHATYHRSDTAFATANLLQLVAESSRNRTSSFNEGAVRRIVALLAHRGHSVLHDSRNHSWREMDGNSLRQIPRTDHPRTIGGIRYALNMSKDQRRLSPLRLV